MIQRCAKINARLTNSELEKFCPISTDDARFLEAVLEQLGLSVRAYHRIIKVARTIADLQGERVIQRVHLSEAIGYRAMDRLLKQLQVQNATF